jgi:hypothetical protein
MNFKTLNTIQKIALIWVTPIMLCFSVISFIIAITAMLIVSILNYSGTIGASLFLLKQIKAKLVMFQFKKIKKQDEQQAAFDRMMHKES